MIGALLRTVGVWSGLCLWLVVSYGIRLYVGGSHYLEKLLGADAAALARERVLARSEGFDLLALDNVADLRLLMAAAVVAISGAFVLLILWPVEGLMRLIERRPALAGRVLVWPRIVANMCSAMLITAAILLSIHPLLNLRVVPEGPRMLLNFACEAAGYRWVSVLAYAGALGAAGVFCGLQLLARERALRALLSEEAPEEADGPKVAL